MSNLDFNLEFYLSENPFVSFDSKGQGLSHLLDNIWDFTAQGESLKQFSFLAIPEEHRANVQSYLFALITYCKKKDITEHISVTRMTYWRDCMTYLIRTWGKSDFSLLSRDDEWREAKARLDGKYSIKSLKSIVSLINKMQEAGLINRHVEHNQIYKLASVNPERQHIALPTSIHAQILEQVINTIETYHPYRHEISDVMQHSLEFRRSYLENELNRLNITKMNRVEDSRFRHRVNCRINRGILHSIPNFEFSVNGDFVRAIADDCLIAVAFFSGARRKELLSMNAESYKEINGVSVLRGLTSKANEGVPIFTTWVSHPLAKKALELAYDITEYARRDHLQDLKIALEDGRINNDKYEASKKELESSFISADMRKKEMKTVNSTYLTTIKSGIYAKRYNISVTEDDVREFNLLNPLWDGELKINDSLPNLNLHSLRRSFAVFLVRHKLGDLQTIKYQLKHKNIKMSAWYANFAELARMENILLDSELFDMVEKVNEETAIDAFDDIYNESDTLSGLAGERIMRQKNDALKRGEKIIMSRDEITRLVRNNSLSVVLLPTGSYCTNPDCERLCSIETFVSEDKLCEYEIVTNKSAKIIKKHRDRLIDTFRKINDMNDYAYSRILAGYKQKILVMEINLRKHNIYFECFNDEINGLII